MKSTFLCTAALAGALATALPGAARAVELASAWLTTDTATEELRCRVVNVGKKPTTVVAELIDNTGANIVDTAFGGCDGSAPLAPNAFCSVVANGTVSAYCRVTSKSSRIRAVLTISGDSGSPTLAIPVTR